MSAVLLKLLAGCSTSERQGNKVNNRTDTHTVTEKAEVRTVSTECTLMRPRKRSLKVTHSKSLSGCYHFPIFLTSNLTIPIKRMFALVTYITLACSLYLLL